MMDINMKSIFVLVASPLLTVHKVSDEVAKAIVGKQGNPWTDDWEVRERLGKLWLRWCPPSDVSWLTNPINYIYIYIAYKP